MALAEARQIEVRYLLEDAKAALKENIGENVDSVLSFKGDFAPSTPLPATVEPWIRAAMVQNLELQSKGLESRIAALEIRRQRSGYLPTLDIVGSYGRTDTGGSIYGDGQDIKDGQIGLQFRMPFSIGRTSSLVREAAARSNAARFERDHERLATEREVRSSFYSIISSSKKLEALRKMVIAQDSALQLRIAGLKGGFETSVTVLDDYRLYYASRYDFLQARYEYLINRLKLKKSVGVLTRSDLEDLAALIN